MDALLQWQLKNDKNTIGMSYGRNPPAKGWGFSLHISLKWFDVISIHNLMKKTTISQLKHQIKELRIRRIQDKITATSMTRYPDLAKLAKRNAGGKRVVATLLDSGNGIRCRYV